VIVHSGELGNQWEVTLERTTNGNMVKEVDKRAIDSLGCVLGFVIVVLAFV
jgi:hypothetical protein